MHVEHERRQGAFQPRQLSAQQHKARTRHFRGALKVHHAQRFAQIDVILGLEIERRGHAPLAHFDVGVFVRAFRHVGVGQIGNGRQQAVQLFALGLGKRFGLGLGFLGLGYLFDQVLGIFATGFAVADFLGRRVAFGLNFLGAGFQRPAHGVQGQQVGAHRRQPATLET